MAEERPRRESNYSPPFGAEVRNGWSILTLTRSLLTQCRLSIGKVLWNTEANRDGLKRQLSWPVLRYLPAGAEIILGDVTAVTFSKIIRCRTSTLKLEAVPP